MYPLGLAKLQQTNSKGRSIHEWHVPRSVIVIFSGWECHIDVLKQNHGVYWRLDKELIDNSIIDIL